MVKAVAFLSVAGVFAKNGAPDASVMLQLKQAEALLGTSATSSPDDLSALLEQHTLDMVQNGVVVPDKPDMTLTAMKGTMTELIGDLKQDIADSQTRINNAKDTVVEQYDETIANLKNEKNQKRREHSDCRDDEEVALDEEQKADEAVLNKWNAGADCGDDTVDELVGEKMWSPQDQGWGAALDGLVATAKAKQTTADEYTGCAHEEEGHICLAKRLYNCDARQREHETKWCELARAQNKGCNDIADQEKVYDAEVNAFLKHSHMIQSARKVICFLNVIEDDAGHQLSAGKVQKCVELNYAQDPAELPETGFPAKITVNYAAGTNQAQDVIELTLPDPKQTCTPWKLDYPLTDKWKASELYTKKHVHSLYKEVRACPK